MDKPEMLLKCSVASLPQSVNRIWRHGRGRTYKSKQAADWQRIMTCVMANARKRREPYEGKVLLRLGFSRKDKRSFDLDNRIKVVQDCLEGAGVVLNDSQVFMLIAFKCHGLMDSTSIEVWTLDDEYLNKLILREVFV